MLREDTMECIRSSAQRKLSDPPSNHRRRDSSSSQTTTSSRKRKLASMAKCMAGIGAVTLCLLSPDDPSSPSSSNESIHRPRAVTASQNAAFPAADDIMHLIDPSSSLGTAGSTSSTKSPAGMSLRGVAEQFLSLLPAPVRTTSFRRAAADGIKGDSSPGAALVSANPAAPTAPLLWVHMPQSGNVFLQTLLWTVCASWPRDWSILDYTGMNMAKYFAKYSVSAHCPEGIVEGSRPDFHGGLGPAESDETAETSHYNTHRGKLVAMFRRPDERVVSSFWSRIGTERGFPDTTDVDSYRQRAAGCITKTLTRDGAYPCMESDVPPTDEEVDLAIARVRDGFAFIGLTEEWNLSICLWHAMAEKAPYVEEFQTYRPVVVGKRPSSASKPSNGEEEPENGSTSEYYDRADEAVYRAAEEVFWSNVDRYEMTAQKCQDMIATASSRADLPPEDEEEGEVDEEEEVVEETDAEKRLKMEAEAAAVAAGMPKNM